MIVCKLMRRFPSICSLALTWEPLKRESTGLMDAISTADSLPLSKFRMLYKIWKGTQGWAFMDIIQEVSGKWDIPFRSGFVNFIINWQLWNLMREF